MLTRRARTTAAGIGKRTLHVLNLMILLSQRPLMMLTRISQQHIFGLGPASATLRLVSVRLWDSNNLVQI